MVDKNLDYFISDIDVLIPYARNARTHSDAQVTQIAASIKEFGFLAPILIDDSNMILCGHGRYEASKKLGLTKVPCIRESHLTDAQKKAYILADNRLALNAGWDNEMLAIELADLQGEAFDIGLLGFDDKELEKLLGNNEEAEDDDFDVDAELEKPCFSRPGDIWKLGRHRVICGDSTDSSVYTSLLGDVKVNLVCTDPPYLIAFENKSGKIQNDNLGDEEGYNFLKSAMDNFHNAMAKDASIYVFYATSKARVFHDAFEDAGFKVGAGLVWKKDRLVLTRTDWKYIHEPIIFGWRKDGKHIWYGDQKQTTVFEFSRIKDSEKDGCGHPTSKPVPLIAYLIKQCTQTNGIVLDGFLGSASTLIACEQLERSCYGVELEPKFVDVAVNRYIATQDGSAQDVVLIRDGKEYSYEESQAMMEEDSNE